MPSRGADRTGCCTHLSTIASALEKRSMPRVHVRHRNEERVGRDQFENTFRPNQVPSITSRFVVKFVACAVHSSANIPGRVTIMDGRKEKPFFPFDRTGTPQVSSSA